MIDVSVDSPPVERRVTIEMSDEEADMLQAVLKGASPSTPMGRMVRDDLVAAIRRELEL